MSAVDVGKLSSAELVALKAKLDKEIEAKRREELKVLADGYAKKLKQAGFSIHEGIDELEPYLKLKRGDKRGSNGHTAPIMHRDPANPSNTWSGRGRPATWIAEYKAAGRQREEFKATAT